MVAVGGLYFRCADALGAPSDEILHSFTTEDLFRLERLGEITVAPDGTAVAFVRYKPSQSGVTSDRRRPDVWIAPLEPSGIPVNITNGAGSGASYWMPTWSPDGSRLAMLASKAGADIELQIWDRATGKLSRLISCCLAFTAPLPAQQPIAWLDNRSLVVTLLPKSESHLPRLRSAVRAIARTAAEAERAKRGDRPTSSVLNSGTPVDLSAYPQQTLAIATIEGEVRSVASAVTVRDIRVSPDRRSFAFLKEVALKQPGAAALRFGYGNEWSVAGRFQAEIVDTHAKPIFESMENAEFVMPGSFRWAPDGQGYAFIGTAHDGSGKSVLFRGTLQQPAAEVGFNGFVDPTSLVWIANDYLLVRGGPMSQAQQTSSQRRQEWWVAPSSGPPESIPIQLPNHPERLLPINGNRAAVALIAGCLWRFDQATREWKKLSPVADGEILDIVWPSEKQLWQAGVTPALVVISVRSGSATALYAVDVQSGASARLNAPSESARLAAFLPQHESALYLVTDSAGTRLTYVNNNVVRNIVVINQFVRAIVKGTPLRITYAAQDGQSLNGWILLPPNYDRRVRYPMVVWVYPGDTFGQTPPGLMSIDLDYPLNYALSLQLLAARGYAVLVPSMPLSSESTTAGDPMFELTNGVLPAIDKVIELGFADTNRLAVMGTSFGGFGTYGLITQTNRFKAAVVLAGPADWLSLYGSFQADWRYESLFQEYLSIPAIIETGQGRMGKPPWEDLWRYIRNSPLFYIDRVQTPLLTIHGELDGVSITQAEEFFTALYRQNKRARFVRYWAEGHVLSSPANIRDMWQQVTAWLDELLRPSTPAGNGDTVLTGR
jgi:hypothetical protein